MYRPIKSCRKVVDCGIKCSLKNCVFNGWLPMATKSVANITCDNNSCQVLHNFTVWFTLFTL